MTALELLKEEELYVAEFTKSMAISLWPLCLSSRLFVLIVEISFGIRHKSKLMAVLKIYTFVAGGWESKDTSAKSVCVWSTNAATR